MSEKRRAGDIAGFDKAHPKYDDSLLPKITVDAKELALIKDVKQMLESGDESSKYLFTVDNISNHLSG
jgi:hypothetical protein